MRFKSCFDLNFSLFPHIHLRLTFFFFLQPLYISYQLLLLFYVAALCLVMRMYCLLCRSHLQKHTSDIIELLTYLAHGTASVDEMALTKGMNDSKGRRPLGVMDGDLSSLCLLSSAFPRGHSDLMGACSAPAFHSNLIIMIFAQDALCLHSVITYFLYDLYYWKSMSIRAPH